MEKNRSAQRTNTARRRRAQRLESSVVLPEVRLAKNLSPRVGARPLRPKTVNTQPKAATGSRATRTSRQEHDQAGVALPPVMARGSFQGIPLRARKLGAPRRRYDVALNVPGAEVRLPSMPVIQPGWRLASGMLILLVAACLFTLWYSPAFRVDSIEVSGLQRLSLADLTTVIRVLDEPVFLVDPGQVTQALQQAFPEISSLEVHVGLPADVSIKLTERQPLISWIQDGQELWVDAEGVSFSPRGDPGQLVRVQANDPPPAQSTANDSSSIETQATTVSLPTQPALHVPAELVSTIVYLGGQIPAEIMLVYDREHGLGWSDPRGWDVYFGSNLQDLEMKLVMYQTLVDTLQAEGIQPALISLEFLHAPYYRMER